MSGILDIPASRWVTIAEERISYYQGLANSAGRINNRAGDGPTVRVSECLDLVRIWRGVRLAGQDGKTFGDLSRWSKMQAEMQDAFDEGETVELGKGERK